MKKGARIGAPFVFMAGLQRSRGAVLRSVRHATAHAADDSVSTTDDRTLRSNATGTTDAGRTDDGFGPIGTDDYRANKGASGNGDNQHHSHFCIPFLWTDPPITETRLI